MEQEIRFTQVDGKRVAYATSGAGPPLLLPAWWVSHLELEWEDERFRSLVEKVSETRTVVRWNRIGTGLSDREVDPGDLTMEAELRTLTAVADRVGAERCELLGISGSGATAMAWAAAHPERVSRLLLWGSYAHGAGIASPDVRRWMIDVVGAHWGLGARVLTDVFLAGADPDAREAFVRMQRAAATPDVAAALIADYYARDVRPLLPSVSAPAIVMHRRGDRAAPTRSASSWRQRCPTRGWSPSREWSTPPGWATGNPSCVPSTSPRPSRLPRRPRRATTPTS